MNDALKRVRQAFDRAGYTVAGVRELLGPVAGAATGSSSSVMLGTVAGDMPS